MKFRLVAAGVLAIVVLTACSDSGAERTDGVITSGGSLKVHDLKPGDCLDRPENPAEEIEKVDAVPCEEQHVEEVFAKVTYTGGDAYPDAKAMEKYATARCDAAFRPYVGKSYAASKLLMTYLAPSEEGWEKDDDRTILCIVTADKPLTNSVKGSKQ
jgi:hypothetical protein